jgi:hypothetical protein
MIKKFKTIKQHYIKSLLNFDKYDNIVEQIIKEKLGHGNKRRQKNSQNSKKNKPQFGLGQVPNYGKSRSGREYGGFIKASVYNKMKYKPTNRGKNITKKGPYEI